MKAGVDDFVTSFHLNLVRLLATWLVAAGSAAGFAHDFTVTATTATFRLDGTYQIDMTVDLDALLLGAPQTSDDAELARQVWALTERERAALMENLRTLIVKRTRIRFDGDVATPEVAFPEYRGMPSEHTENPAALGVTARLSGRVPVGATKFTFWASRAFQAVHLTIMRESGVEGIVTTQPAPDPNDAAAGTVHILAVAEESPPYSLRGPVKEQSRAAVAFEYLKLGFTHILPKGVDHILFVLGLFLLSTRWSSLLWQVTAFTIAHSITLGLSIYDVVPVSEELRVSIIEPLIALSIAYVAIENLFTTKLHIWRPVVVFAFGLLHGLGFAGVLTELGLPRSAFATALISFNIGVEAGQICVLLIAFAAVGWMRGQKSYRRHVVLPISCGIAVIGIYTAAQRAFLPEWPGII